MAKPISFNFPNIKEKSNKKKVRSDAGTHICIWCGDKEHGCSEIFLFQRSDSNGNEHHLGYVFIKENMYKDKLFTKFVDKAFICEECKEHQ